MDSEPSHFLWIQPEGKERGRAMEDFSGFMLDYGSVTHTPPTSHWPEHGHVVLAARQCRRDSIWARKNREYGVDKPNIYRANICPFSSWTVVSFFLTQNTLSHYKGILPEVEYRQSHHLGLNPGFPSNTHSFPSYPAIVLLCLNHDINTVYMVPPIFHLE